MEDKRKYWYNYAEDEAILIKVSNGALKKVRLLLTVNIATHIVVTIKVLDDLNVLKLNIVHKIWS